MRRFAADTWLGLRLAVTGGADSRLRAALTGVGVALGVALLLFGASVPNMLSAHNARLQAREPVFATGPGTSAHVLDLSLDTTYHGRGVTVVALQPTGSHPRLPPGIARLPQAGQMLVSPALKRLLSSPSGAELQHRLHAHVAGTIAPSGLTGPAELFAYRGAVGLARHGAFPVARFGVSASGGSQSPLITLLVILMVVALLLPIGVFVASASRFGSAQRDERLAALRLLGLDRAGTARVAAGEALLGAVAGEIVGVLGFVMVVRPLVPHVDIANISVFSGDVRPSLALTVLALVLVPASAVGFALLAMRRVAIEPLGVSRRGRPPRRRLAWRLLTPALGFLLLFGLVGASGRLATTTGEVEASAGIVLVLIGVCALLPWMVEAAVVRAGSGPVAWLLAVRRLRVDHGTSGRVVGAIGLAVAGAIALQTVFNGAERAAAPYTSSTLRGLVSVNGLVTPAPDATAQIPRRLREIPGVRNVLMLGLGPQNLPVTIATCSNVRRIARVKACSAGSSYLLRDFEGSQRPGEVMRVPGRSLRIPLDARVVPLRGPFAVEAPYLDISALLLTPAAARRAGLPLATYSVYAWVSPTAPGADDRLRDEVARIDPLAQVNDVISPPPRIQTLDKLRRVLTAGAVAVLLVIGASLLVSIAEQIRERRRVLAVMSAFGTRASTLAGSVLWQTALPVALGLALAIVLGAALGAVLMEVANLPVSLDWGAIAVLTGAGAGVVGGVTAATLPILRRQLGPGALRAE